MQKRWLKSGLSLLLALSLTISPVSMATAAAKDTAAAAETTSLEASAQQMSAALTAVYGAASVQYALISDGKIILSGQAGYNNIADKTAPTRHTKYGIGSISKIFTTLAVLKLVEQGRVELDKPVYTYVPDFKMADERYKDITVRMLLNHSSGLMGSTLDNAILLGGADSYTHDRFLKTLSTQRLKAAPGAFSVYCNDGFTLAEILVEKVSRLSFSDFIAIYLTSSLEMADTKTPMDDFKTSSLAGIYLNGTQKLPYESLNAIGAGGIYSTAEDLCRLSLILTKSTNLFSNASIALMEQPEYKRGQWTPEEDGALSYGLGWDSVNTWPFTQYGIKALVKGGDSLNYHGSFIVLPEEKMAVAVLTSGGASTYAQVMGQTLLLEALKEKGRIYEILPDKTFTPPEKLFVPDELLKYEGCYGSFAGIYQISIDKTGSLVLSMNGMTQRFIYGGNGKFYSSDGSTCFSFVEDKGNTYLYASAYATLPLLGQTATSTYQAQKLTPKELSSTVKAAWDKYLDKDYFIVSERYNSYLYVQGLLKSRLSLTDGLPNYIAVNEIMDATTAAAVLEIPAMYGRDLADLKITAKNNTTYVSSGATRLISADAVKYLSTKKSFKVTLPKTDYAKYYKISSKSANKTLKVTLPKKASFTVYDKAGKMVFSSLLSGKNTVKLPKGGYIVFSGSHSAVFKAAYK